MIDNSSIDLLVGIYGDNTPVMEALVTLFLDTLYRKCNMSNVEVFLVLRKSKMPTSSLMNKLPVYGSNILECDDKWRADSCMEDTGIFCNWMVDNIGGSPWFAISHFDIVFHDDYISYVRTVMPIADMVGNHHDGVVLVKRESYNRCAVGFTGVDCLCVFRNSSGDSNIVSTTSPTAERNLCERLLALDVGELLSLRMTFLRLTHIWIENVNGLGKCDLFTHLRNGSRSNNMSSNWDSNEF